MRRESKWTHVYFDASNHLQPHYIRFTPDFFDLEAAGFGHGLSLSGNTFATKEGAERAADVYDKFFDVMEAAIIAGKSK